MAVEVVTEEKKTKKHGKRGIILVIIVFSVVLMVVMLQAQRARQQDIEAQRNTVHKTDASQQFAELIQGLKVAPEPTPSPTNVTVIAPNMQQPTTTQAVQQVQRRPQRRQKYYSHESDRQAANQMRMIQSQAVMGSSKVEWGTTEPPAQQQQRQTPGYGDGLTQNIIRLGGADQKDPNNQEGKIKFAQSGGADLTKQGYSEHLPVEQRFLLELKAGSIIPGILITGINSDLPGQIIGQVSENVYDTARGQYILIPKGTRILGAYDSQVTFGQRRILVVWNRLVFPNGTTLNISGSPGIDQSGYSGMTGRVNEHWGKLISTALFASLFVTGAELVYDKDDSNRNNNDSKSPSEAASESAANAILEVGARMMEKVSDIQPTITIKPGKKFNIFVQEDVVFPTPYRF